MTDPYSGLAAQLSDRGVDVAAVEARLGDLVIETPSWGYGDSGTRFGVFPQPGRPRDIRERVDDAAEVHRLTGTAGAVAMHFPWDAVDDYDDLRAYVEERGLRVGAVNPNLFQDPDYKLGSVTHPDAGVRAKAVEHLLECLDIARALGSDAQSLWLADGTNYPGQDDLRGAPPAAARLARAGVRRPAGGADAARRVQVLRARLLRDRPRRLGLRAARLPGARRAGARCSSTSATTPRASTWSRSSACWPTPGGSAASTSTTASTPTTTSSSARSTRSSCS